MSTTVAGRSIFSSNTTPMIELTGNLISRDIKTRYKQSLLGLAWAVINPLVMALIYTLLGYYFLKQRVGAIPFPIYAYVGLLFWNLFATGLNSATESLVSHISLITKIYFPREVFPMSAVLGKVVDLFFGLLGLIPLLIFFHVTPGWSAFLALPLLVILLFFTLGLGMLAACANLFYRDVRHVVGLTLGLWLYMVPNFYTVENIPPHIRSIYFLNPMAVLIDASRKLIFPQLGRDIPWRHVGLSGVVSLIVFAIGYAVFKHFEPQFAESI